MTLLGARWRAGGRWRGPGRVVALVAGMALAVGMAAGASGEWAGEWADGAPMVAIDGAGVLHRGMLSVRGGVVVFEVGGAGAGGRSLALETLVVVEPSRGADVPELRARVGSRGSAGEGVAAGAGTVVVRLTDGQTLAADWPVEVGEEALRARARWVGGVEVELERVDRLEFAAAGAKIAVGGAGGAGGVSAADVVVLINGDRVEGFVEGIDAEAVSLERAGRVARIPLAGVAVVDLASEADAGVARSVTLIDGTVLGVRAIEAVDARTVVLTPSGFGRGVSEAELVGGAGGVGERGGAAGEISVPLDRVALVRGEAGRARLVALRACRVVSSAALDGRVFTAGPVVVAGGGGDAAAGGGWSGATGPVGGVEIRGASEHVFGLPTGAAVFRAEASAFGGAYTAFTLEVAARGGDVQETALGVFEFGSAGERESILVEVPRGAVELVVRVRAGESGAIQDNVLLERAGVIVRE